MKSDRISGIIYRSMGRGDVEERGSSPKSYFDLLNSPICFAWSISPKNERKSAKKVFYQICITPPNHHLINFHSPMMGQCPLLLAPLLLPIFLSGDWECPMSRGIFDRWFLLAFTSFQKKGIARSFSMDFNSLGISGLVQ